MGIAFEFINSQMFTPDKIVKIFAGGGGGIVDVENAIMQYAIFERKHILGMYLAVFTLRCTNKQRLSVYKLFGRDCLLLKSDEQEALMFVSLSVFRIRDILEASRDAQFLNNLEDDISLMLHAFNVAVIPIYWLLNIIEAKTIELVDNRKVLLNK